MKTKVFNQFRSVFRIFGITLVCGLVITACDKEDKVAPVSLNTATVSMLVEELKEVTISGGTAPYVAQSTNKAAADATVDGSTLKVTGVGEGSARIVVTGNDGSNATLEVTVTKVPLELLSFADLKAKLTSGESVGLPKAIKIKGVVISDAGSRNIEAKTVVLQEASDKGGIIVWFAADHGLNAGDEAEVEVSNLTLAKVNGELVIKDVPAENAVKTGTGAITPRETNTDDLIANKAAWNGTLVKLGAGAFIGGNGSYKGTLIYTDEKGTVKSTILTGAAFENVAYPINVKFLTGIVRLVDNEATLEIRNVADVENVFSYVEIIDFQTMTATPYPPTTVPPTGPGLDFTLGRMITQNNFYVFQNATEQDRDFLADGKKYAYLGYGATNGQITFNFNDKFSEATGGKNLSFTFALSKTDRGFWGTTGVLSPYNPATTTITVNFRAQITTTRNVQLYRTFLSNVALGEFQSLSFTIPSTKEELMAFGVSGVTDAQIDQFIANPRYAISIDSGGSRGMLVHPSVGSAPVGTPFVVRDISIGFNNKPSWAN